jgi:hypothetical protein
MTEENSKTQANQPVKTSPTKGDIAAQKEQRVAQALRDNLRRRKLQKKQESAKAVD